MQGAQLFAARALGVLDFRDRVPGGRDRVLAAGRLLSVGPREMLAALEGEKVRSESTNAVQTETHRLSMIKTCFRCFVLRAFVLSRGAYYSAPKVMLVGRQSGNSIRHQSIGYGALRTVDA